jgi:hypothetical protein
MMSNHVYYNSVDFSFDSVQKTDGVLHKNSAHKVQLYPTRSINNNHIKLFFDACTRCCFLQHANGRHKDVPEEEEDDDDGINEASSRLSLFAAVEGDGASSCRPLVHLLFDQGR